MGDEIKAEETTETKEAPTLPSDKGHELRDEDVRDNIEKHNVDQEYEPLFDDEAVSEDLLKGEDGATGESPAAPEPKGDKESPDKKEGAPAAEKKAQEEADKKKADEELEKRAKEAGKTVDEIKAEDKAKVKPDEKDEQISGLNTALHQERKMIKQLKARVAELETEITKGSSDDKSADDPFKDFKVLSDQEYEELLDDDPDEATKYLYKFGRYQEHQRKVETDQRLMHDAQHQVNALINEGIEALEAVIPGISKGEAKEDVKKLTEFALKNGFDNEVLTAITDPGTKIVTRDNEVLILSDGAAQVVKAIKSAYEASTLNKDQIRKELEAELRPKIEAEVQKTLIEKLQKDPESGFRSLDMAAGSGLKEMKLTTGPISEADYARLSDKERAALLGG